MMITTYDLTQDTIFASTGLKNKETSFERVDVTKRKFFETLCSEKYFLSTEEKKLFLDKENSTSNLSYFDDPKGSVFIPVSQEIFDMSIDLHKIRSRPLTDFISLQKYEGVVMSVEGDSFWARLINITKTMSDEEAQFSISEVSEEDQPMVAEGAIFYWNIGYLYLTGGQRLSAHLIRFRRLPALSATEIKSAELEANKLSNKFGWK